MSHQLLNCWLIPWCFHSCCQTCIQRKCNNDPACKARFFGCGECGERAFGSPSVKNWQYDVSCLHISSLLRHSFDILFHQRCYSSQLNFALKQKWRPKKLEKISKICVQGYTWAIGAVGQLGAGSLKNLITSSQPWQGWLEGRWGLLRVPGPPPQKKQLNCFDAFFFRLFFLNHYESCFDQNVSSFIIMYHLSSLFVIPLGLVGSTIENLWKNSKHGKWRNLREKTKSVNW